MGKRRKKSPNFILRKQEGDLSSQPSRIERETKSLLEHLTRSNQSGCVYTTDTPFVPISSDFRLQTTRLRVVKDGERIDRHEVNVYGFVDRNACVKVKACFNGTQRKVFLEKFAREFL